MISKAAMKRVMKKLMELYPSSETELEFSNPFELLIATILSAQCTDVRVNIVTKELFKVLGKPEDIYKIDIDELENKIRTCGLYKMKAKNINLTCNRLIEEYDSKVPSNMEDLLSLAGVGRKVANVVMASAYGIPAIAVDTHVFRVSNRIGFVNEKNVEKTEKALMEVLPRKHWIHMHHTFIYHGRKICSARSPKCSICPISKDCKYYKTVEEK